MSKLLNWEPKYQLNVEDIDFQHRYFLNLINRLSKQLEKTDNFDYGTRLALELNAYVKFHFISEENMMLVSEYPLLDEHQMLHHKLLQDLSVKQAHLALNRTMEEAKELLEFLIKWFLFHTAEQDKKFADFLHEKMRTPGTAHVE